MHARTNSRKKDTIENFGFVETLSLNPHTLSLTSIRAT